jgi:hypothetical protein
MSLGLAFSSFFKILSNANFAQKVRDLNNPESPQIKEPTPTPKPIVEEPIKKQSRSEAVTLLSSLQRDARLIDFLMENIKDYEDAQIGAAVRDVHKKSKEVLQKMFAIEPASTLTEGQSIKVPENFDQGLYILTGKISGKGPFNGSLEHAGWKVTKTEIPLWNGTNESANIIAPTEVEVK